MIRTLIALCFVLIAGSAQAANRFWVGGTDTWDATAGSKWSTTSGGAGGAAIPGSGDIAIFDTGSGTVTVAASIGGTNTVQHIRNTGGANSFTGTLNFATNSPTISTGSFVFTAAGSPIIVGGGTMTVTGDLGFDVTGANASSNFTAMNIIMAPAAVGNPYIFVGAGRSYGSLTRANGTNGTVVNITGANTFGTLTIGSGRTNPVVNVTQTITSALNLSGSSTGLASVESSSTNSSLVATFAISGAAVTASWAAIKNIAFTGGTVSGTAIFDIGGNTNVTASAPPTGGSGGKIIGGGI